MRNKKRIKELEDKISSLKKDFIKLKFSIENPPKYKVGDKYKGGIVYRSFIYMKCTEFNALLGIFEEAPEWYYSYIEKGTGKEIQIL